MAAQRVGPYVSLIIFSLLVGMLLAVFPLPPQLSQLRPEFVCLLVIYWIMRLPQHLGMLYAWSVGLLQDVVEGSVWGAHALSLTVVAYICLVSYQRIRNYSVWHQSFWIFVLVGIHQEMNNWIQGLAGYHSTTKQLLMPTMVTALCWPLLMWIMRRIRRFYRLL